MSEKLLTIQSGWGGRASDKLLTMQTGFLDKLQHGDFVLADRGSLLEEEMAAKGAVLNILYCTRGKKQLSGEETNLDKCLMQEFM